MRKIFFVIVLLLIPTKVYCISARSAIMMDTNNHRILYGKNINEQRSVASISKIMTAVLALESGRLDEYIVVGDEIDYSYGSGIYIEKGEQIKLKDLVYGLMLRSGNDAALTIAKNIGGNNFVDMMNKKAKQIGMLNTIFNNPSGLDEDEGNYSTAYDMAILTSYAMKNIDYQEIVNTKNYIVATNRKTYLWINKNKLLFSYKYSTGGKTGYTEKAKRTLVTTASKDNLDLVVVTLNDSDDFSDHRKLFDYGFNNYRNIKLINKGYLNIKLDKKYNDYRIEALNNYYYPIGKDDKILINYQLSSKPKDGLVGHIIIYVNDILVHNEKVFGVYDGK